MPKKARLDECSCEQGMPVERPPWLSSARAKLVGPLCADSQGRRVKSVRRLSRINGPQAMGFPGSSGATSCGFFCRTKQKRCVYCPLRLAESLQIGGCQAILRKIQAAGEFPAVQSFLWWWASWCEGCCSGPVLGSSCLGSSPTHYDVCRTVTNGNQSSRNLLSTYMMRAQLQPFPVPDPTMKMWHLMEGSWEPTTTFS